MGTPALPPGMTVDSLPATPTPILEPAMPDTARSTANTLEPYFMPFTANRQFKSAPRIVVAAAGMHYTTEDGRRLLDGSAGMWCVNAGHGREKIVRAIQARRRRWTMRRRSSAAIRGRSSWPGVWRP